MISLTFILSFIFNNFYHQPLILEYYDLGIETNVSFFNSEYKEYQAYLKANYFNGEDYETRIGTDLCRVGTP